MPKLLHLVSAEDIWDYLMIPNVKGEDLGMVDFCRFKNIFTIFW